ncbi:MAG TPA: metalloregulator ArsR/SmtB family transcription factor [Acidimicrobiales bacterium]|nr:metalloregulator ArsR/SmtB family transcription factor [Acidimicrobiales bacterium]
MSEDIEFDSLETYSVEDPSPVSEISCNGGIEVDPLLRQELDEVVSSMCKALNDPKRLVALYALRDGPHSVNELCLALGIPQANTSQHLAVLRERGLVSTQRQGNKVLYSLRYPKVLDAVDVLRDVLADEVARKQAARSPRFAS